MALLDIPSYPEPCLAPTKDNSTVYLVGTPVLAGSNLNVNIVSIDDINAPVIKKKFSAPQSYEFFSDIPRKCSSYLGDTLAEEYSLHIQQVGFDSSWDKMFFAHNGTFRSTGSFVIFSFSKQSYSYIGLAGPYAWALAVITDTRNTIPYSAWGSVFLNLTSGDSHLLPHFGDFTTTDPLLTVGTYTVSDASSGSGNLIVFDKAGTAEIFPTVNAATDVKKETDYYTSLLPPKSVNMNGIKLTADAFYANMGTGAYILDKADDGSLLTYYIDPTISNDLKQIVAPNSTTPRFMSTMAATSAGSKLVLYSTNSTGIAKFHIFNTATNLWSGPEITYKSSNTPLQPTEGHGSSQSSSNNLGAIIGGVVGGIVILAAVAFFVIRHRRRRSGHYSNDNGTSHNNEAYSDKDTRSTGSDARSPEGALLPGNHPQFPAGVPLGYGQAYGLNYGQDGDLGMPSAGPHVNLSSLVNNNSAMNMTPSNAHHGYISPNISQPSQEISHQHLQALTDGNKAEIDNRTSGIVAAAPPHPFGDKAELDSSSEITMTPFNQYTPPPQTTPPPLIPARPSTHAHFSLAQDSA